MADAAFLVDSDVLIDFLRGDSRAADWLSAHGHDVVGIPVVVLMELLQGARSAAEQRQIQQGLSSLSIQHLETGDTHRALEWFATYRLTNGTGIMDCLIASVAARLAVPLYTFNNRHFAPIPGVRALQPYERSAASAGEAGPESGEQNDG